MKTLRLKQKPAHASGDQRIAPVETTVYEVQAALIKARWVWDRSPGKPLKDKGDRDIHHLPHQGRRSDRAGASEGRGARQSHVTTECTRPARPRRISVRGVGEVWIPAGLTANYESAARLQHAIFMGAS